MGIRETLNKSPLVAIAAIVLVIAVAGFALMRSSRNIATDTVARMYYSDDDGASYFADDTSKIFPFDHNGKQAYRAYIFQGTSGQPFVGYISRYTDSARKTLLAAESDAKSVTPDDLAHAKLGIEVKKPHDNKWVPALSSEGQTIAAVRSTDNSILHEVLP